MKQLFTSVLAASLLPVAASAAITVASVDIDHSIDYAGGVEIDINNDGYMDLIFAGRCRNDEGRIAEDANGDEVQRSFNAWQAVWNPSTSQYDITEFPALFGIKPCFVPVDLNGDGYMDFIVSSETSAADGSETGVYINQGNGKFTRTAINITDADGNQLNWEPRSVDVADFNCDGRIDIASIGWRNNSEGSRDHNCLVLINKGDLDFEATVADYMTYNGEDLFELALCTLTATDLNNDGYADILIQGNIDNAEQTAQAYKNGQYLGRTFAAYLNLGAEGEGEVLFYDLGLADGVSHHYGNGNIVCADFNSDGVMDVFVTGESPADGADSGSWNYIHQLLQGKISGSDVSYTDVSGQQAFNGHDIRPLGCTNVGVRAIDYTGNGYFDLFLDGWCTSMLDGGDNTQAGWLLKNNGSNLSEYERVPGASEIGIWFMEDGVQGARNYTFSGYCGDATYFDGENWIGRTFTKTVNPYYTTAPVPAAPQSLSAVADGYDVTLSWSAPSGEKSNVTYEYYIKEITSSKYYTAPLADTATGLRRALRQGNAFLNKTLNLVDLPDGTYEWGVQTINAALAGSEFVAGPQFKIGTGIGAVTSAIANTVNVKAANGQITISGAQGIAEVYSASGALVARQMVKGETSISLSHGCYIVKVGNAVKKVIL
ncbi:MAG: T9SS type A sorting domain-containing protein [Bacteroidales bacterium]|nr:T9SS type A sorting domain-containing protein [Bacteroidales bacterium]